MKTMPKDPLFPIPAVVLTPGAKALLTPDDLLVGLIRHVQGDWGTLNEEDCRANDEAILTGCRLHSEFVTPEGVRFWFVTEPDRSLTTVTLPEEH